MKTLQHSLPWDLSGQTSLSADSLAKISAWQMSSTRKELMGKEAVYGGNSTASFARYDLATSLWRTSQLCFTGELAEYLETWPTSGTMRNGICYKLPTSDSHINANGSLLLPTPTTSDAFASIRTTYKGAMNCIERGKHQTRWFYYGIWLHNLKSGGGHPQFAERMMGFPSGWTDLNESGTPLCLN
jgi:hypothetical protein